MVNSDVSTVTSTANNDTESARKLRNKERRLYTEEFMDGVDLDHSFRLFSVDEKLASDKFNINLIKEMKGEDFNVKYLQRNGFKSPILCKKTSGLGMKVPDSTFTVRDAKSLIGGTRILDVMDVTTQTDSEMTMKEWSNYWDRTPRDRILNVISLEFSHTKFETLVEPPKIVKETDWVNWVWPKFLKESQVESTNAISDMKYPKVQKYILMSVKGCFTDFHIDFGGTSVWYHIIKGHKVFWLIPPTEKNFLAYEEWVLSGKQADIFFGDTVEICSRIELFAGDTFFIPSGWIHAVYTPQDSIVFGGNFLHSFAVQKQLRVAQVEDTTKVPAKFRYPFYNEMLWYVLERYVYCLTGKTNLSRLEDGKPVSEDSTKNDSKEPISEDSTKNDSKEPIREDSTKNDSKEPISEDSTKNDSKEPISEDSTKNDSSVGKINITSFEVTGLKSIITWLSRLPSHKRCVPELVRDAEVLLNDARVLVEDHSNDSQELACTGRQVLSWKTPFKPSPFASVPIVKSSNMSLTSQLRQLKAGTLKAGSLKAGSLNKSKNETPRSVKRSASPPTRPVSVNQYSVKPSVILDQIPSSFEKLIASTGVSGVVNNNFSANGSSDITSTVTTATTPTQPLTTSFSTQTLPLDPSSSALLLNQQKSSSALLLNQQKSSSALLLNQQKLLEEKEKLDQNTPSLVVKDNVSSNSMKGKSGTSDSSRRRRTRCKKCEACVRSDCSLCNFCKDMKKFGGPGRMKQSCLARQCTAPVLPHTACCMICGRDGWEKFTSTTILGSLEENMSSLMECSTCWEILHPLCLKEKNPAINLDAGKKDDLPNSWECPKCVHNQAMNKPTNKSPKNHNHINANINTVKSVSQVVNAPSSKVGEAEERKPNDPETTSSEEELPSEDDDDTFAISKDDDTFAISKDDDTFVINKSYGSSGNSGGSSLASSSSSSSKPPSFVKSCARFPLLQEAIRQQELLNKASTKSSLSPPVKVSGSKKKMMIESGSERKKTIESSSEKKKTIESSSEKKKTIESSSEKKKTIESSSEKKKTIESSGEKKKTIESSSEKKMKIEPEQSSESQLASLNSSLPTPTSLQVNKSNESLKDRLFRSLESLKRSSDSATFSKPKCIKKSPDSETFSKLKSIKKSPDSETFSKPKCIKKSPESDPSSKKQKTLSNGDPRNRVKKKIVGQKITETVIQKTIEKVRERVTETDEDEDKGTISNSEPKPIALGYHGRPLVKPKFVIRPAPLPEDISESDDEEEKKKKEREDNEEEEEEDESDEEESERTKIMRKRLRKFRRVKKENLSLERDVIVPVLAYLSRKEIISCSYVCKEWNRWSTDPTFWSKIDVSSRKIRCNILTGIVRRQPTCLDLSWTHVTSKQLSWLMARLPGLKQLNLSGCQGSSIPALASSSLPLLQSLDLSFIDTFDDETTREIFSPPIDSRPGLLDTKTRLRLLTHLSLAGTDITDTSVRLIASTLIHLTHIDLGNCSNISDMAIAFIASPPRSEKLTFLQLYSCDNLTESSLDPLKKCLNLTFLDLRKCDRISSASVSRFYHSQPFNHSLILTQDKLIRKKASSNL